MMSFVPWDRDLEKIGVGRGWVRGGVSRRFSRGREHEHERVGPIVFEGKKGKRLFHLFDYSSFLWGKKKRYMVGKWSLTLRRLKPHSLKRNIGQFSGYVWVENEEKQKARVREKMDKYVKEKLVDLCDLLNIPFMRTNEEVTAKLLEFLESPHATTDVLLADQEQVAEQDYEKVNLNKRIAKLSGGVAVIQVGAQTDFMILHVEFYDFWDMKDAV
ncbi:hypothetical protein GOBAR_AA30063 [Gossypium barbadense]|uniref:Uncharacterized protein n=1 Tax=Gossypium barbadense TaxID=3634 RepID=A0A2P5WHQ2_GOSBA|nr:hypothetical protein GOBAR_AA30063 [Gossypium barbadense]